MSKIRCAIYTRKSSDEGLEQDFNSLHAQREACSAYVLSQASEGWKLLPEFYDDGGLSGGTLERPALQRLLADVKAGSIDIIVVYKVDRLTRSLLDFAKLVDMLDAAGTSFVSVTQSFNTTSSMGRLTLNMLLSFAQFEREVTAERIRDKIAASKAKGMWMGGSPPLGYKPEGRSLAIVDDHAVLVRAIYQRYLATGNVRLVAEGLLKEQITTPPRVSGKGQAYGGGPFTRGQLYTILRSPIYAGDIPHKGKVFPGNHPPIISRERWDAVQALLTSNSKGQRRTREQRSSLLAGLLTDAAGEPLIAVHTNKGTVRYRYYVSKVPDIGAPMTSAPTLRLPAREIEQVVKQELAGLFVDAWELIARLKVTVAPSMLAGVTERCSELSARVARADRALLVGVVSQIAVHPDKLVFSLCTEGLAELLGLDEQSEAPEQCIFEAPMRLTRTGRAVRLIHDSDAPVLGGNPDASMIRLILKARRWWGELLKGEINIKLLAAREHVTNSYVTRVLRLVFLSPQVVEAALSGNIRAGISGVSLLRTDAIASDWREQVKTMLPDAAPII